MPDESTETLSLEWTGANNDALLKHLLTQLQFGNVTRISVEIESDGEIGVDSVPVSVLSTMEPEPATEIDDGDDDGDDDDRPMSEQFAELEAELDEDDETGDDENASIEERLTELEEKIEATSETEHDPEWPPDGIAETDEPVEVIDEEDEEAEPDELDEPGVSDPVDEEVDIESVDADDTIETDDPDAESDEPKTVPRIQSGGTPHYVIEAILHADADTMTRNEVMDHLSDECDASAASVSSTLSRIASNGLLNSRKDPDKRSQNIYSVTDFGKRAYDKSIGDLPNAEADESDSAQEIEAEAGDEANDSDEDDEDGEDDGEPERSEGPMPSKTPFQGTERTVGVEEAFRDLTGKQKEDAMDRADEEQADESEGNDGDEDNEDDDGDRSTTEEGAAEGNENGEGYQDGDDDTDHSAADEEASESDDHANDRADIDERLKNLSWTR